MKAKYYINLISTFIVAAFLFVGESIATQNVISSTTMINALEMGCSLIVIEVINTKMIKESFGTFYAIQAKGLKPIIIGDLSYNDIYGKDLTLFAGANYPNKLIPKHKYILFITKDLKYDYDWDFRDSTIDISNETGNEIIINVAKEAKQIYKTTSIYSFRLKEPSMNITVPKLPRALSETCSKFKASKTDRNIYAEQIAESDLGSKRVQSFKSNMEFTPPKILLNRDQIIQLLGYPDLVIGRSYFYSCGKFNLDNKKNTFGLLTIRFDNNSKVKYLGQGFTEKEIK